MKTSVKLALRASEIRQKVNELPVDEAEKRSALLGELSTVETEYRAALTAEAAEDAAAPSGEGLSAEERERRQLENRAEHRVDAVSAAPSDSHLMQHSIIGRVFARSATMALGVAMPAVPVGQQNFPVISAGSDASVLAKDASVGDAGAATLTAHTISSTRLQVEYIFRREDQATLMGIEEALRRDLSGTLAEQLDKQVLVGGASPNFGGFLSTPAATYQGGVVARVGGEGMNAVAPIWSGVAMVRDEVSQELRKKGQISLTAIMMCGFDILRPAGFARTKFKIST